MRVVISVLLSVFILPTSALATKEIHQHVLLELDENTPVPQISLNVFRDETDGVNLHIQTNKYILNAPHSSTPDSKYISGHAHLFINAKKVQRVYGADVHLPASLFRKGVNQIAISLNSHQHENYTKNGQNIVGSVYIDLNKPELVIHGFSSQPITEHKHH